MKPAPRPSSSSSDTGQTLRTDTAYILNFGTTVSDRNSDAITINGIAPVTFTNAGVVTAGESDLSEARTNNKAAGIRFNVDGSLNNQASGDIWGEGHGVRGRYRRRQQQHHELRRHQRHAIERNRICP